MYSHFFSLDSDLNLKVGDFGLTLDLLATVGATPAMPWRWMPPEVLRPENGQAAVMSQALDVVSIE